MKKSKFSEEQIAYALRQADSGTPVGDVCRQLGVYEATFYVWKKKYGKLGVSKLREIRQLRDENARLKRLVADLTLDKHILSEVLQTKSLKPARGRQLVAWIQETFQVSTVRSCRLAQFTRAAWYRKSTAQEQAPLAMRIRDLAHARPRFGYQRITVLLRRGGWPVNRKRVRRLYRLQGLQLRMRVRRREHMCLHRGPVPAAARTHERWSMDFVHDALVDGRAFRVLTIVDQYSHGSPLLEPAFGHSERSVAGKLGTPVSITVAHGTEFTSKALEEWAWQRGVKLDFTRPGKPTENGHIESFNGRLLRERRSKRGVRTTIGTGHTVRCGT